MNHLEFENKAVARHGHRYDYSKAEVTNNRTKVEIVCKDHGSFFQAPDHHIRGRGCPKCATRDRKTRRSINAQQFFEEANRAHGGFYDYTESNFTSMNDKIRILCPLHGHFTTLARKHLQEKRGCQTCGRIRNQCAQSVFFQDFFDSAIDRHGHAYSYAEVSIKYLSDVITVVCKEHGPFEVSATKHLQGEGCPKCRPAGSTPENELASFIEELGFAVVRNSRKLIPPFEIDIYLPDLGIAFEFNGIFWHSEQQGRSIEYHQKKTLMCKRSGIRLFHVYESEWDLDRDEVKNRICSILNPQTSGPLEGSYCIEEYCGSMALILKGKPICRFYVKNGIATDYWSPFGLSPIRKLMDLSGVDLFKSRLDWPEFSASDFVNQGMRKAYYVRPERLYFDKKTLRQLKEKPGESSGLDYYSVVDSGSAVWNVP